MAARAFAQIVARLQCFWRTGLKSLNPGKDAALLAAAVIIYLGKLHLYYCGKELWWHTVSLSCVCAYVC